VSKFTELGRGIGWTSFGAGTLADYFAWDNNIISGQHAVINFGMGFAGNSDDTFAPISLIYFAIDAIFRWGNISYNISHSYDHSNDPPPVVYGVEDDPEYQRY